jgi:predicted GNAT family N-acyltransferase
MKSKLKVIRVKTEAELAVCRSIRKTVFILEQKVPESEEYDGLDGESVHYLAFYQNKAVGTARWRKAESGIKLERFAILKAYRNKNIGAALVKAVLNDVKPLKKKIYLNAQLPVKDFYQKYNFITEGDIFEEAGIQHIKMIYQEEQT